MVIRPAGQRRWPDRHSDPGTTSTSRPAIAKPADLLGHERHRDRGSALHGGAPTWDMPGHIRSPAPCHLLQVRVLWCGSRSHPRLPMQHPGEITNESVQNQTQPPQMGPGRRAGAGRSIAPGTCPTMPKQDGSRTAPQGGLFARIQGSVVEQAKKPLQGQKARIHNQHKSHQLGMRQAGLHRRVESRTGRKRDQGVVPSIPEAPDAVGESDRCKLSGPFGSENRLPPLTQSEKEFSKQLARNNPGIPERLRPKRKLADEKKPHR